MLSFPLLGQAPIRRYINNWVENLVRLLMYCELLCTVKSYFLFFQNFADIFFVFIIFFESSK